MKRIVFFLFLFVVVLSVSTLAQCPMCGEAARTSLKEGNNTAKGINAGILFLLSGPYLMIGAGGFIWYRSRKKAKRLHAEYIANGGDQSAI
jgi:hypothetical protein